MSFIHVNPCSSSRKALWRTRGEWQEGRRERKAASHACLPDSLIISFHFTLRWTLFKKTILGHIAHWELPSFRSNNSPAKFLNLNTDSEYLLMTPLTTSTGSFWKLESGLEVLQELRPHSVHLSALNLYVIHKTYLSYQTISCRLLSASFSAQFTSDHERGTNTTSTRTCAASLHEAALPPELDDNSLNSHILFPTSSRSIRSAWCTTLALHARSLQGFVYSDVVHQF